MRPANILLTTPELDKVIKREITERPASLYEFPKTAQHEEVSVTPVMSAPLSYAARDESPPFHWVIADFGHGTMVQRLLRATDELDIPQHTSNESTRVTSRSPAPYVHLKLFLVMHGAPLSISGVSGAWYCFLLSLTS